MNDHIFDDEYSGVGGEYVVDPNTGKRVPVKAEKPAPETKPAKTTKTDAKAE